MSQQKNMKIRGSFLEKKYQKKSQKIFKRRIIGRTVPGIAVTPLQADHKVISQTTLK